MSDALTFRGPHFSAESERSEWPVEAVGLKAAGLAQLPVTWTPPFVVVTAAAFIRWKEESSTNDLSDSLSLVSRRFSR